MSATIRVMVWNIQNFGPLKSGLEKGNTDVIAALASIVVGLGPDIFILVELNTTSQFVGSAIAQQLGEYLNAVSKEGFDEDFYKTCIVSPSECREFYAFFVRDRNTTMPYRIVAGHEQIGPPKIIGGNSTSLANALFEAYDQDGTALNAAPLILPDLPRLASSTTLVEYEGNRPPAFGLFMVEGAGGQNALLAILACHTSPDAGIATGQIRALPYCSPLQNLAPLSQVVTQINIIADAQITQHRLDYALIAGDMNVDINASESSYGPIVKSDLLFDRGNVRGLGATAVTRANTLLVTYNQFSERDIKTTEAMAVSAIDNIFCLAGPNAPSRMKLDDAKVYDVPAMFYSMGYKLGESVEYYASLDQRGFESASYQDYRRDFASQLTGSADNQVNLRGSLVGGRLLSDHQPVIAKLTF